jgi:hypothetical protein
MACAVSLWVCIASIVMIAAARLVIAFRRVPHRGDLVRFRVHGDLAEDRADPVGQRRDQVRGLPGLVLAPRAVLPSMVITSRPAACVALVFSQPPENPVKHVGADQSFHRYCTTLPCPCSGQGAESAGPMTLIPRLSRAGLLAMSGHRTYPQKAAVGSRPISWSRSSIRGDGVIRS